MCHLKFFEIRLKYFKTLSHGSDSHQIKSQTALFLLQMYLDHLVLHLLKMKSAHIGLFGFL